MVRAEAPSGGCQIRGTAVWQDGPHAASCGHLEPECADPRVVQKGFSDLLDLSGSCHPMAYLHTGRLLERRRHFE